MTNNALPRIDATALAQFVRLESCERFLWYRLHPKEMRELLREYKATEQPLSILLKARGARHEQDITNELEADDVRLVDLSAQPVEATAAELEDADGGSRALIQPRVAGKLGGFDAAGIADVILLRPGGEGLRICIEDAKASRKDRPEHRVQIGFYAT